MIFAAMLNLKQKGGIQKNETREQSHRTEAIFPDLRSHSTLESLPNQQICSNQLFFLSLFMSDTFFFLSRLLFLSFTIKLRLRRRTESSENDTQKFMSFDSIKVEQHRAGLSVTSKNMEMCSKSMCININTAECSRAHSIICAMDIYAVTQNELVVTLPS